MVATRWIHRTPAYAALDFVFSVETTDAELGAYLERACSSLPRATESDALAAVRFGVDGTAPEPGRATTGIRLTRNGRLVARASVTTAMEELLRRINLAIVRAAAPRLLLLHGGLVGFGDQGVLVLGASGAGKSTLTAALVLAGGAYGSDELVGIDPATGVVEWLARPIVLKTRTAGPEVPGAAVPDALRPWFRAVRLVAVDELGGVLTAAPPVARVVMPTVRAGARCVLAPVARVDALVEMLDSCFNLRRHARAGFGALATVAEHASAGQLVMGDVHEAARLVVDDL